MKIRFSWDKFWGSRWNIVRGMFEAFFCVVKNGKEIKTFSAKKFFAFAFAVLTLHSDITLVVHTDQHWIVDLTKALKLAALSDNAISAIIITIITTMNGMCLGALAVYGWAKAKDAA